jgi:response regulator RpfG family c-di-GMP phosphodiesterase
VTTPLLATLALIAFGATAHLCYYAMWKLPKEARERLRGSVRAFSHAVECRCNGRLGRTQDVAELARAICAKLRLSRSETWRMELATYLRDIGLTAIPYGILNTHPSQRSTAEQATFDRHPEIGGSMLELIPSLKSIAPLVQFHDAWWDGSATPYLPAQMEIPVESRVIAVAAAFAETAAMDGLEAAEEAVEEGRGTRFDPVVVDACLEVLGMGLLERWSVRTGTRAGTA